MSPNPIHYAGLGGIIGRHLHLNLVPNHQPDETLAHLSGNMRKNLVFTGKLDLEHGSGKNGRDGSLNLKPGICFFEMFSLGAQARASPLRFP